MRMKSVSNLLTLLLALAGCVVAIALTYEDLHPKADIGCRRMGGDCASALHSDYGHLGRVPTSVFGLGMYVTLAGLCLARHKLLRARRAAEASRAKSYANVLDHGGDGGEERSETEAMEEISPSLGDSALKLRGAIKRLDFAIWSLAAVAIAVSWWLQYAALFVICSYCPWCFSSAVLVTLIFLVTSYDFLIEGRKLDGEQKLLAAISTFIILCFGFVFAPVVYSRIIACGGIKFQPPAVPTTVEPSKRDLIFTKRLKFKGDPKARYALIEFADYQCPHCKKASARIEELLKTPPSGGIRLAFRNFPLDQLHQWARPAAMAVEAAGEQGKFWEMHDAVFAHQEDMGKPGFSTERFDEWAEQLGLDINKFKSDVDSKSIADRVADDHIAGELTHLDLTPSFYLVTPTQVTLIPGLEALEKTWHDPKDKAWK